MPIQFNTPAASPTENFSVNTNSPVVGFPGNDGEIGAVKERHNTPVASPTISFDVNLNSPIRAYPGT